MTPKENLLATLRGQPRERVPFFPLLMAFAAKRYGVDYARFASDGETLAAAQARAAEMFPIDAVTACSDAFRLTADIGGDVAFFPDKPPAARRALIESAADLARVKGRRDRIFDADSRASDRTNAVRAMVRALGGTHLVLGWIDLPFAEACSMCGVQNFLMMLYDDPELAHAILDFLRPLVTDFAKMQICAGAPMIGAGNAAASLLSPALYAEFAQPYDRAVFDTIHAEGALCKLHICGDTRAILGGMRDTGADLISIDNMVSVERAKAALGPDVAFKGNLDPVRDVYMAAPDEARAKALALLSETKGYRYILSPGCEVPADTPDETFLALAQAAREPCAG